jgi:hypothetical protein
VTCSEASRSCSTQPKDNGTACNNNALCMVGTTCQSGLCVGGTLNDCLFAPVGDCEIAVCDPMDGMCKPEAGHEGEACSDAADPCLINTTCAAGVCQGGTQNTTCSLTSDNCCPSNCDAGNDADC